MLSGSSNVGPTEEKETHCSPAVRRSAASTSARCSAVVSSLRVSRNTFRITVPTTDRRQRIFPLWRDDVEVGVRPVDHRDDRRQSIGVAGDLDPGRVSVTGSKGQQPQLVWEPYRRMGG